MIEFSVLEAARKQYGSSDMPFFSSQRKELIKNKKYQNLKILHNIPLTMECVFKVEPLLLAGADLTVSCVSFLSPNETAVNILKAAGVQLQIDQQFSDHYDIHLDCCAELVSLPPPRIGTIELTQTGGEIYKKTQLAYPLISVDDSQLKLLETHFGTGDGFVRAMQALNAKEIYDKKFVVFGFGKVGQGIVRSLIKFTDNITVIDMNAEVCLLAKKKGIKVIHANSIDEITQQIKNAYCVVCATGVKNLLSEVYDFDKTHFGTALLANMGASDEYGKNFHDDDILFNRQPLNFSISEPTAMKYLEPVLYAHNIGIDLLLSGSFPPGYSAFPEDAAANILNQWMDLYNEKMVDIFA